ncbi:hypothetical protein ACNOYE_07555 [Nannocystaceae bacterium ST9]
MPTTLRHRLGSLAISSLLVLAACDLDSGGEGEAELASDESESEGEPAQPIDLIDPGAWLATAAELDPLADHRPETVICPTAAYQLEFGLLEVDTGQCNYLSVSQPLAHAIDPGDPLRVTVWWQTLIAGEPAEGHLALLVDDELLWETHVAIPGEAELRQVEFTSPITVEPGATLTFHLHNHGYNSWTLGGLELLDR